MKNTSKNIPNRLLLLSFSIYLSLPPCTSFSPLTPEPLPLLPKVSGVHTTNPIDRVSAVCCLLFSSTKEDRKTDHHIYQHRHHHQQKQRQHQVWSTEFGKKDGRTHHHHQAVSFFTLSILYFTSKNISQISCCNLRYQQGVREIEILELKARKQVTYWILLGYHTALK